MDFLSSENGGLVLTVIVFTGIAYLIRWYLTRNLDHWKKKGVPYLQPEAFFGNYRGIILNQESYYATQLKIYRQFKGQPYGGIYEGNSPSLVIMDPDLIRRVVVRDADHFEARSPLTIKFSYYMDKIPLIAPERERKMFRQATNPHVSYPKMKAGIDVFVNASQRYMDQIEQLIDQNGGVSSDPINVPETAGELGAEMMWEWALGSRVPRRVLDLVHDVHMVPTWQSTILLAFVTTHLPHFLSRIIPVTFIHEPVLGMLAEYVGAEVDRRMISEERKEDALQAIIDIAIKNAKKDNSQSGHGLNKEEKRWVISQVLIMVEASYDNFGNVLGSMFRLLSLHQDVQSKLGKEIEEVLKKHSNKINMESIKEMKYLTMVLSETLRCFPTLARMERTCTKDYTFPTGLTIEKNTRVNVPLYGLHNDPKYYPNPEKFDPERFTENAKSERPPYVYLPFGNGPRKCVGIHFSEIALKVFATQLLKNFWVFPTKSDSIQPSALSKKSLVFKIEGGIWLTFKRRGVNQYNGFVTSQ